MIACAKCKCGKYCSVKCRDLDGIHAMWCPWITQLEEIETEKRMRTEINMIDTEKLPLPLKKKLVKLVGEKPLVTVNLNGKEVKGLWDTGAMVSLMNRDYLEENFREATVIPLEQFTGQGILLSTANKGRIDIEGVAVLRFGIGIMSSIFKA